MLTMDSKFKFEHIFKGKIMKNCRRSKIYKDGEEKSTNYNSRNLDNILEDSLNRENTINYNIWNLQLETKAYENSKDYINEVFINYMNESRSLTSKFEVIVENKEEKILMLTKLSTRRDFNHDMLFFHNFK